MIALYRAEVYDDCVYARYASVGPPWQADHPRVSVLHLYSHIATNFHHLQGTFGRETLAGLPLEKLACEYIATTV